ncbi:hypothetical protein Prudu_007052, partial [Prunus dulcis]
STELDSKAPIFRLSFSSLRSLTLNHFNPRKATIDLNHHNLHCFNQTHSHIAKISLASYLHHHRCIAIFIVAQPESHLLHHQTHLDQMLVRLCTFSLIDSLLMHNLAIMNVCFDGNCKLRCMLDIGQPLNKWNDVVLAFDGMEWNDIMAKC